MPHQLIITADDYGMCESVNEGIEECLAAGALRSTCVMTNMPEYRAAAGLREQFPHASIGVHWTLTLGKPVLPATQVPDLVDHAGSFLRLPQLRPRLMRRAVPAEQLRAELTAQVERFREVCGAPDYWNTHQNVHVNPGLFAIAVEVGSNWGFP
jgi:predicted glycoside hydrolase/deacetylase ChbG (UPF0249 family)